MRVLVLFSDDKS